MLSYQQVRGRPVNSLDTPVEVLEYLEKRGISRALAATLGLKLAPAAELIAQARGGPQWLDDTRHAIVFPHYDLAGRTLDWWSARLVARTGGSSLPALRAVASFQDYVDTEQSSVSTGLGKMFCPPTEPPAAYLPPGGADTPLPDWARLPRGESIYIHESVIKAINCAVLGKYAVGLNGVWGWGSTKHNIALVAELKALPWKALELNPIIVYDADVLHNAPVLAAATKLAERLLLLTGRTARLLVLPQSVVPALGAKYGFDDLCHHNPALAAATLEELPQDLELSPIETMKIDLNQRCAVISSISRIADIESGTLMSLTAFADVNYAHFTADVELPNGALKPVNVPRLWLKDPRRTVVDALAYEPGQPRLSATALNLWRGWGTTPLPGDITPWLQLLANNVQCVNQEDQPFVIDWIIDWLAYPLQHPGAKLNTLLLLFGPSGTGKDLFLEPVHRIYGSDNSVKISNDEIKSTFTSLYTQRQFVHADELKRVRDSADLVNQRIKSMVTAKYLTVNRKGDPEYKIRNTINVAITSNYYDCIKLDEDDRRATVVRWSPVSGDHDHRGDQPYWQQYVSWLEGPGPSALFYELLTRDLSRFDPAAWALATTWKDEVIDAARSPIERFVALLRTSPYEVLPPLVGARKLFTSKELALYHFGADATKAQIDAVGNELRNQNIVYANRGKPVRSGTGLARWYLLPGEEGASAPSQEDWTLPAVCTAHLKLHGL